MSMATDDVLAERRRLVSAIQNRIDPLLKKCWAEFGSFEGSGYYVRKQMTSDETYKIEVLAAAIYQTQIDPNHKLVKIDPDLKDTIIEVIGRILGSFTESQVKGCMNRRDQDCLYQHRDELHALMEVMDGEGHGKREYNGKPGIVIASNPPKNQVVFEPPK